MPHCDAPPEPSALVSFCANATCSAQVPGALSGSRAGFLEEILVPVEHHGGALEGSTPGLATGLAVQHERGEETLEPGFVVVGLHEIVDRDDGVLVDEGE